MQKPTLPNKSQITSTSNATLRLVVTSLLASLSIALRLFKHLIVGPIQIINLPAVICIIAALELGPVSGASVGLISFIGSDIILGFGIWTFVTASFMGAIGLIIGTLKDKLNSNPELFIVTVILLFLNDIGTSVLLYIIIGFQPLDALVISIIGLFLPAGGGYLFAVGPITEISSALLVVLSRPFLKKAFNER